MSEEREMQFLLFGMIVGSILLASCLYFSARNIQESNAESEKRTEEIARLIRKGEELRLSSMRYTDVKDGTVLTDATATEARVGATVRANDTVYRITLIDNNDAYVERVIESNK